ncbi:MAG: UDP-N-acetylmuramoyl-L-alanyl-D-glutamate--2,6-diaminopimelate ligase [Patescibacteria group bacterium]|nr:UDP-N-acetylmuramoyl-L-alanyl-D-glutamate--2,6-diaminopimelate ligase [Patescibacteria group bacterium]
MSRLLNIYHWLAAYFSSLANFNPSKRLIVIGVTGTKGKSTTLELINAGLEAAGKKTALVSSVRIKIGDKSEVNKTGNTMPGRGLLQKMMRRAVKEGCEYALLEVTSQGIVQHREEFIDFDAAVFLNLQPEHLEAHGGFENYKQAKLSFFRYAAGCKTRKKKAFFVNKEDKYADEFIKAAGKNKIILFGKSGIKTNLPGEFNKINVGAAEAVLENFNVGKDVVLKALEEFAGLSGRMEFVSREPFAVVVDYAHTPDSLQAVYETVSGIIEKRGKLVCVFGSCGGGRDKWKRPEIGKIAARHCGYVILTDEDPFDEDPLKILHEIEDGLKSKAFPKEKYEKILDRSQAIKKAISLAKPGDGVVITGKGSEPFLHKSKGVKIPWSDKKIAEEALGTVEH